MRRLRWAMYTICNRIKIIILVKKSITPADQAEAIYLLVGDRLKKTTGQILTVRGSVYGIVAFRGISPLWSLTY